ncbi:ornithine carbamoyltransferase [Pseudomonas aeruginosa]|nr:ornithine carbamoyltransferase [Pseudomonas aeruginosa]
MAFNMHNRNLLSLMHHSTRELRYLLDLSRDLKRAKYTGTEQQHLKRKNIALIFEKTSTRTRCAFEVAGLRPGRQRHLTSTRTPRRSATRRA